MRRADRVMATERAPGTGTATITAMGTAISTTTATTMPTRTATRPLRATITGTITPTVTTTDPATCTAPAAATTTMATDAARLALLWLASPALPVGAFSYSETLEAAIEAGDAAGEDGCAAWLLDQLALSLARCDLPIVAAAMPAWQSRDAAAVEALNTWVLASRESAELRRQVEQTGRSLADWIGQRHGEAVREALAALPGGPAWPVAFASAAAQAGAPVRDALLAFAFGWAENLVQAAVKAVPLGQSAGQRMLGALAEAIPAAVDAALACPPDERQAFTPMLAIRSAQHEVQYSRLFRS